MNKFVKIKRIKIGLFERDCIIAKILIAIDFFQ